jgi:hypothetical protein
MRSLRSCIERSEQLVSELLAAREQDARDTLAKLAAEAKAAGGFEAFKTRAIAEANTLDIRDRRRRLVKRFFREEEEK